MDNVGYKFITITFKTPILFTSFEGDLSWVVLDEFIEKSKNVNQVKVLLFQIINFMMNKKWISEETYKQIQQIIFNREDKKHLNLHLKFKETK